MSIVVPLASIKTKKTRKPSLLLIFLLDNEDCPPKDGVWIG